MKAKKLVARTIFVFKKKYSGRGGDHLQTTNSDPTTATATLTATSGIIMPL